MTGESTHSVMVTVTFFVTISGQILILMAAHIRPGT